MTDKENKEIKEIKEEKIDFRKCILEADDLPIEEISVPEWIDKPIYIRAMTGMERDAWERSLFIENQDGSFERNLANFRGKLLVQVLCSDKEGKNRIFSDADADALGGKNSRSLDRCVEAAQRLNGISKKDQDNLVKNSDATQD